MIVQKGTTYTALHSVSKYDGVLGLDFLSRFNITFDFKNKYMALKITVNKAP